MESIVYKRNTPIILKKSIKKSKVIKVSKYSLIK